MKVIEVGNVTKRIKCSGCSSKLEYGPADVRIVNNDDAILAKQVIDCPVCAAEIFLTGVNGFPWALVRKE